MPVFTFGTCCFPGITTSPADAYTKLIPSKTDRNTAPESSASGAEYDQIFQDKVAEIVAKHFNCPSSDISTQSMQGGGFNQVVGVTVSAPAQKFSWKRLRAWLFRTPKGRAHGSYIVRIPRHNRIAMDRDVVILKTVISHLALPIPEVVTYDLSSANLIEKPYMIQKRLPGQNLWHLWDSLNMEQKKCAVKLITELVSTIATVEGPPGELVLYNTSAITKGNLPVEKFSVPSRRAVTKNFQKPNTWPALAQSPFEHLLEQCERWREYEMSQDACFNEVWDGFSAIIKSLNARGFLDGPCVLTHGDLLPRNLTVEVRSNTEIAVTGVIDWDLAIVAPEFVAYRAPFWLWIPDDIDSDVDDDEDNANFEPKLGPDRELKNHFILHAPEKYKRYAFAPEAMLARRMFKILQKGLIGDWEHQEVENIILEWEEMHPEDGVADIYSDSKSNYDEDSGSDDESDAEED